MKTIFDQTVNGKSVKLELNEKTGALWITRDGKQYNECFRELYYVRWCGGECGYMPRCSPKRKVRRTTS